MAAPDADRRAVADAWCKGDPWPQPVGPATQTPARVTFDLPAGLNAFFAPDAFDDQIGTEIAVAVDGTRIGTGRVVRCYVPSHGSHASITVEMNVEVTAIEADRAEPGEPLLGVDPGYHPIDRHGPACRDDDGKVDDCLCGLADREVDTR